MGRTPPATACDRAREQISLRADDELSELGIADLERHLARCAACATFARDVGGVSRALRAAPPTWPDFAVELPRRRGRTVARTLQLGAVAAAAGVLAIVVGGGVGGTALRGVASARHGASAAERTAYLDSATYEQRLINKARLAHEYRRTGSAIPQ
jgi:anti-sigma factor RsiW